MAEELLWDTAMQTACISSPALHRQPRCMQLLCGPEICPSKAVSREHNGQGKRKPHLKLFFLPVLTTSRHPREMHNAGCAPCSRVYIHRMKATTACIHSVRWECKSVKAEREKKTLQSCSAAA